MKKIMRLRRSLNVVGIMGLLALTSTINASSSESISDTISSMMNHRLVTSAPLLYKQIDWAHKSFSLEIEPWVSGMFNPDHVMENLGINGQSSMTLDQLGGGDINPELILLGAADEDRNYASTINLKPKLFMLGALVHLYKQYEHIFFDVRTALINCKTQITIDEVGGGNGGESEPNGTVIENAYDAFTQSDWNYGKFGASNNKTGLDNIQVLIGSSTNMNSFSTDKTEALVAGFALIEIPTSSGSNSEWLFEPQVGTNHWGFGAGLDFMVSSENGCSLVAGGNYRYLLKNWETRSFDLQANGQWSRYLGIDTIALLGTEGPVAPLQGINFLTQDALIDGRSQVTAYARFQKRFDNCLLELSYNFFYNQNENISLVDDIDAGYGIYYVTDFGGVTTAHLATIADANPAFDPTPIELVTSDLNLASGAAGEWMSNSVAARFQYVHNSCTYGFGGAVDIAATQQAMSTWSAWLNFEILIS